MSPHRGPVIAVAALLLAPGAALAKEVSAVTACGAGGHCRTVAVHGQDGIGLVPGGRGGGPPDHRAPFYRLTLRVDEADQLAARIHVLFAPSLRLVAMDEPGADVVWETPPRRPLRIAERATRGLTPRPAASMPIERPAAATIVPRATPAPERDAAGPGTAAIVSAIAALLVAVGLAARRAGGHAAARRPT